MLYVKILELHKRKFKVAQIHDWLLEKSPVLVVGGSIILTSNKSPGEWGNLIGEQGIMTAILDRLLHRVEVIHGSEDEESHRMRNRKNIFLTEV